ncbi:MAG TPA: TadE/TadG family type IV pilus assembly protein [Candidatus Limnocylindrales bacterium]
MNKSRDRGSVAVELAILTPAMILFFLVTVVAGRITLAQQAAEAAAFEAARTASLARDAGTAHDDGEAAALASFASQGIQCTAPLVVEVDTSGFGIEPPGTAVVTATVSCSVQLSDVALPGMPGSLTLAAEFTSPLDRYRSRSTP